MDERSRRPSLAKVWSEGPGHAVGEWRNVLMTAWLAPVQLAPLEVTRTASWDLHGRYPDGIVVFNVIPHMISLPPSEVRKRSSEILGETGGHVLCTTTIIGGTGLWASAARAAVATITLFSRAPHPHKVFGTVEDGADWASGKVIDAAPTADLVAVANDLLDRGALPSV